MNLIASVTIAIRFSAPTAVYAITAEDNRQSHGHANTDGHLQRVVDDSIYQIVPEFHAGSYAENEAPK